MTTRPREQKVCGVNAAKALAARRADDVLRVYLTPDRLREFSELLKDCARRRRPYRVVPADELSKIAASVHHEGICVVVRPRETAGLAGLLAALPAPPAPAVIAVLNDVRNPHNLGAILRTCAHFGAVVLLTGRDDGADLSPAAARMAEGGAEAVAVGREADAAAAVAGLKAAGLRVFATAARGAQPLYAADLPPRAAYLFGAEAEGLPRSLIRAADGAVTIPGTGAVESLNVSCAVAAVLSEAWRRRLAAGSPARG